MNNYLCLFFSLPDPPLHRAKLTLVLRVFFFSFISSQGVLPATIAVKNGVFRVGLEADEIVNLSMAGEEGRAMKCSTRDLPLVAASEHGCSTADEKTQWGGMFLWRLYI